MKNAVFSNYSCVGGRVGRVQRKLWNTFAGSISCGLLGNHSAYLLSDGFAVQLVVHLPNSRHCQGGHGQCREAK